MKRIILFIFLILLAVNVTGAAEMPYFIEGVDGYVWINDNINAGVEQLYIVEKTPGYSPNGNAVFIQYHGAASSTYHDSNIVPYTNVIYEGKVRSTSASHNLIYGLASIDGISTEDLLKIQSLNPSEQNLRYAYAADLTSSTSVNEAGSFVTNQWYNIRIVCDGSNAVAAYVDDNLIGTSITTNLPDNDMGLFMYAYTGTGEQEYSFVRQYVANTPTVSVIDKTTYYEIRVNSIDDLTNYQIPIPCSNLGISSSTDSLLIQKNTDPLIIISLDAPVNNSYINSSILKYNISGIGLFNATVFIDGVDKWNGSVSSGENQINVTLSDGLHSWYVNGSASFQGSSVYNTSETWVFTYDSTNPFISVIDIYPEYDNIADGTTVKTNIKWSDPNLNYANFYIDNGSGYYLSDSINFSSSLQWFNSSIDTTGLKDHNITWKQTAYDLAGNYYTYTDNFSVVQSELTIYVYDEGTGLQILPSSIVIYNDNISKEASISETTKTGSLSYGGLSSGKYLVNVDSLGYYSRRSILLVDINSLTELNVYLPSTNETVIFDKLILTDQTLTYDESECILRLDKPLPTGTETVFSSYLDFDGITSTHLIATDQYILYIITPDKTVNYGWLTPDSDGEIRINLQELVFSNYYDEWLDYTFNSDNDTKTISLDYESQYDVNNALFTINSDGTEIYNSSISTDAGSFTHVTGEDGNYLVSITIDTDQETFSRNFIVTFGNPDTVQFFPSAYPEWVKSLIVLGLMIVFALAISAYRADLAAVGVAMIYGVATYNSWVYGNALTVSIIGIIAVASIVKFQRKQNRGMT